VPLAASTRCPCRRRCSSSCQRSALVRAAADERNPGASTYPKSNGTPKENINHLVTSQFVVPPSTAKALPWLQFCAVLFSIIQTLFLQHLQIYTHNLHIMSSESQSSVVSLVQQVCTPATQCCIDLPDTIAAKSGQHHKGRTLCEAQFIAGTCHVFDPAARRTNRPLFCVSS
jgi:hypothetical protein